MTLQPRRRNAPIVCALSVVALDSNPKYEALSYEWGKLGTEKEISVETVQGRGEPVVGFEVPQKKVRENGNLD